MKNTALVVLVLATLGLGAAWWTQSNQTKTATAKLAAAEQARAAQAEAAAAAEAEAARLRERLEAALLESARNAGQAAQLSLALTNRLEEFVATQPPTEETNAATTNPLTEMFRSPEMREMIRNQQKAVLGTLVDQNYAAFFKAMNLTPEQSAAMKDLILNKMLSDAEMGMDLMSGDLTPEQRTELANQAKARKDELNETIKGLLGPENYATYEAYEKSIPDRMAVNQLKTQFGEGLALNNEQETLLIQAMGEERQAFKFTTDFNNQADFSGDFLSQFTEENLEVFLQEQQRLNQNYLNRAQTILSAEQLAAYQKALTAQQEMAKMGLRMAVQMFAPKKN